MNNSGTALIKGRTVDTMAKSKWINNDLQNITQKTKGQLMGNGQKKMDKQ